MRSSASCTRLAIATCGRFATKWSRRSASRRMISAVSMRLPITIAAGMSTWAWPHASMRIAATRPGAHPCMRSGLTSISKTSPLKPTHAHNSRRFRVRRLSSSLRVGDSKRTGCLISRLPSTLSSRSSVNSRRRLVPTSVPPRWRACSDSRGRSTTNTRRLVRWSSRRGTHRDGMGSRTCAPCSRRPMTRRRPHHRRPQTRPRRRSRHRSAKAISIGRCT